MKVDQFIIESIQQEFVSADDARRSVLTTLKYLYRAEVLLQNLIFKIEFDNQDKAGIEVTPR